MGLLGDIYSTADQVKRRVKGLLDPSFWSGLDEDARTRLDQMKALAYQNDPNKVRAGLLFPQQARNEVPFNQQQAELAKQRLEDIAMQGATAMPSWAKKQLSKYDEMIEFHRSRLGRAPQTSSGRFAAQDVASLEESARQLRAAEESRASLLQTLANIGAP